VDFSKGKVTLLDETGLGDLTELTLATLSALEWERGDRERRAAREAAIKAGMERQRKERDEEIANLSVDAISGGLLPWQTDAGGGGGSNEVDENGDGGLLEWISDGLTEILFPKATYQSVNHELEESGISTGAN
jgi:hypothetical protein